MSDVSSSGGAAANESVLASKSSDKKNSDKPDRVYLVSYPKIMFLYPTVLTSLFCAVFMWMKGGIPETVSPVEPTEAAVVASSTGEGGSSGEGGEQNPGTSSENSADESSAGNALVDEADKGEEKAAAASGGPTYHFVCARVFLLVFLLNLVVIAFDFPRTTSLTWFFAIVAISIGIWSVFRINEGLAPKVVQSLLSVQPFASSSFYFIFTTGMLFLFICVLISRRFDYWEVRGNELLHHHGFLSDLERFSAPNLRIDKEINDVFEYLLLRSGRLILHPNNERRAIVLENVLFISEKEDCITRMLGALQVRLRAEPE